MKMTLELEHRLLLRRYAPVIVRTLEDLPSLPALWDSARSMFSELMSHVGSIGGLSRRRLGQTDRFELVHWVSPLENLLRSWLVARAVTWLLMSSAGRKLLRQKLDSLRKAPRKITIPSGWHTIARHWQPEPPPPPPRLEPPPRDLTDPRNWQGCFQAITPETQAVRKKPCAGPEQEQQQKSRRPRTDLFLARRVEMIARVLAKPDNAIRRIARQIVRLPFKTLQAHTGRYQSTGYWMHGAQEFRDVRVHERCAVGAFYRSIEAG